MPKKRRVWYPGAKYHITSRGNRRNDIFKEAADYYHFLKILEDLKEEHGFTIHSICLMTNHFHMLIETGDVEIWKTMQMFLRAYAVYFNKKYVLTGHLFENRYVGQLISDQAYFLEVSRYIHLNPVKAGIVRRAKDYKYSSYADFLWADGKKRTAVSHLVDTSLVLSCFWGDSRKQYRLFVEDNRSHVEEEKQIQKDMKEDDFWMPRYRVT